ncbi:GNAT family N-acetyltransferase [Microbacterium sp. NPDC090225]|uniref:GNAT family N-acetyltransferase n=1 Tax=Microbacterium sp. NPDC090225 TaxID=3364207 RepID=UPI00380B2343
MNANIRPARSTDAEFVEAIESAADALLVDALGAWEWPPAQDGATRLASPGFVLLIEDDATHSPVGFVHVLDADGHAHLEQLSVLPSAGRQGHGRALVRAALHEAQERGYSRITLRTYAEVPWNAPFYASCGFLESLPETAFQRSLIETEEALGLERHGRRVQMTAELDDGTLLSEKRPRATV